MSQVVKIFVYLLFGGLGIEYEGVDDKNKLGKYVYNGIYNFFMDKNIFFLVGKLI